MFPICQYCDWLANMKKYFLLVYLFFLRTIKKAKIHIDTGIIKNTSTIGHPALYLL